MLYWALVFAVIALVAGVFGFGGVASAAAGIARSLFFYFPGRLPRRPDCRDSLDSVGFPPLLRKSCPALPGRQRKRPQPGEVGYGR